MVLQLGKIIDYGIYRDPPTILGYDVAGVVEDVGPNITNYRKGDKMYSRNYL
jgi:NADPH:quinone reductase-like Zn-dependent oxidoreductase